MFGNCLLSLCQLGFVWYAALDIISGLKEGETIGGTPGSSAADVAGS
jgi:hypothetical protein